MTAMQWCKQPVEVQGFGRRDTGFRVNVRGGNVFVRWALRQHASKIWRETVAESPADWTDPQLVGAAMAKLAGVLEDLTMQPVESGWPKPIELVRRDMLGSDTNQPTPDEGNKE